MNLRIAVVGGGIVGVATAYRLSRRFPQARIQLLEKESALARHQTGRNSGVVHSGIYYPPDSLKARTCLAGRRQMEEFCLAEGLPTERCGKLIVATRRDELERLQSLHQRGLAHGLAVRQLNPSQLREIEPHCRGVAAVWVPETGIIDYTAVTERLAERAREAGVDIRLSCRLISVARRGRLWILKTAKDSREVDCWINCAGLYSDRVVALSGHQPEAAIVPFRGEYYELREDARSLCRGLIYPVPDPRFPFLGVHFTRALDGSVEAGPNAVLSLGRENYTKWAINWRETWETLTYPGFQRLALRYWKMGAEEMLRSFSRRLFHRALQRLIPDLRLEQLVTGGSGIRAQAVRPDGALVDDFLLHSEAGVVHVLNAPSPAATSSLAIADHVVDRVAQILL